VTPPHSTVARLLAELRVDRGALDKLVTRLHGLITRWPVDPESSETADAVLTLQQAYTAFESMAERIAFAFEGPPARAERWHSDLLENMSLDIPSVRPAVIGPEALAALRHLLGLRRFVRHAYAVTWDVAELRRHSERLLVAHPQLSRDLDRFEALLAALLDPP
jgi:hypothetical protein